jgi:protein involved in polysaccharide export with SLBB domain
VVLAGCGGSQRPPEVEFHPFTAEEQALMESAANALYRFRPGDVFGVDFKYHDELDQRTVHILPDGRFTMAGMENVRAVGMTVPQLDSLITDHFGQDYVNPDLSVIVERLAKFQVYVLGQVLRPGLQELPSDYASVLGAISAAGGFTKDAAPSETILIRITPTGYEYRRTNLSHLEKRVLDDPTFLQVFANDIVYVPRSQLGDLSYFNSTVLSTLVNMSRVFWDIYAITNLGKVDRLVR